LIGSHLDKYEVLQKIGEGGMATVYLGRHNTLSRDVAIKVLHPHLSSSTRNRKRFAREARAIEHLRHDNILEIYDYSGLDANECYIITEFVDGQTLSDLAAVRGRLPSETSAIVGLHLARALQYAHKQGILHRDLKPDNVMVREDGTVKLMDFGIARFLNESQVTMTGALVGSPAFMSPEQAREGDLDGRSDLFSLGTMLFYLVTGHLPFSGSNPSLILKNVIESNRPNVSELAPAMSASFADIIERLMANNPGDRFPDAGAVVVALEASLAESGVEPTLRVWSLSSFLQDPEAFERRLEIHLTDSLLVRARTFLDSGDHLAALRLLNRLLSMDEDNEEALELVQGLHGEIGGTPRRSLAAVVLVAMILVGILAATVATTHKRWEAQRSVPTLVTPTPAPERPVSPPRPEPLQVGPIRGEIGDAAGPTQAPDVATTQREAAPRAKATPRPRPEEPTEPPVAGMGKLKITSTEFFADIYLHGQKIGTTRDRQPIELSPGSYEFEVRSTHVLPMKFTLYLAAGEEIEHPVRLQPKPASVLFDASYSDTCQVFLDRSPLGSLGGLGRRLEVRRPTTAHTVRVTCGEAGEKEVRYPFIQLDTRFPPLE
jgi:eukaryotic-like serine/threonine-protein kinase